MIEVPRDFFWEYLNGFGSVGMNGQADLNNDLITYTCNNRDIAYSTSIYSHLNRKHFILKHIRVS